MKLTNIKSVKLNELNIFLCKFATNYDKQRHKNYFWNIFLVGFKFGGEEIYEKTLERMK